VGPAHASGSALRSPSSLGWRGFGPASGQKLPWRPSAQPKFSHHMRHGPSCSHHRVCARATRRMEPEVRIASQVSIRLFARGTARVSPPSRGLAAPRRAAPVAGLTRTVRSDSYSTAAAQPQPWTDSAATGCSARRGARFIPGSLFLSSCGAAETKRWRQAKAARRVADFLAGARRAAQSTTAGAWAVGLARRRQGAVCFCGQMSPRSPCAQCCT
jgi:hypothetical protein